MMTTNNTTGDIIDITTNMPDAGIESSDDESLSSCEEYYEPDEEYEEEEEEKEEEEEERESIYISDEEDERNDDSKPMITVQSIDCRSDHANLHRQSAATVDKDDFEKDNTSFSTHSSSKSNGDDDGILIYPYWQSNSDNSKRKLMIRAIARYLYSKRSLQCPAYYQRLVMLARKLEYELYISSSSVQDYSNLKTLPFRLKQLATKVCIQRRQRRVVAA